MINGGQVAVPWAKANVPAIVEAFYPGQYGGDAIASLLFGDISPSGRLPYTMYDADFTARRPSIGDMSLSANGGITYQYYTGTPLWRFGRGLSYTTFNVSWASASAARVLRGHQSNGPSPDASQRKQQRDQVTYIVSVTNTGSVTSDVTVLAYADAGDISSSSGRNAPQGPEQHEVLPPAPLQRWLVAFCRLRAVAPSASAPCELDVAAGITATTAPATYTILVELGDGTGISGRLEVV